MSNEEQQTVEKHLRIYCCCIMNGKKELSNKIKSKYKIVIDKQFADDLNYAALLISENRSRNK